MLKGLIRRLWVWPWELRRRGVLGINARNLDFVFRFNPRALYRRLDDKVLTKEICEARLIPVPHTYAIISRFGDVRRIEEIIGNRQEFAVKPACGSGGRGVIVIVRHEAGLFYTSNGERLAVSDLRYHLSGILSGLHSLGGRPDRVIIEERITRHPAFRDLAVGGTPDIRVLVYRGDPVLAMLRLPTRESRGRANLHQGAVGVGIDIATGTTTNAVHHDRIIAVHPDSGATIAGLEIPFWTDVLATSASLSRAVALGYIGVDIVLDARSGPVVLEANARPGLGIQIANGCGLFTRCAGVAKVRPDQPSRERPFNVQPQRIAQRSCGSNMGLPGLAGACAQGSRQP